MDEEQKQAVEKFQAAIRQQEKPVLVSFWAAWSIACLMYKEKLEVLPNKIGDIALIESIDIDYLPEVAEQYSILTIPTTLIFFKGEIVKQYIGIQEPDLLIKTIEDMVGIRTPTEEELEELSR